MHPPRIVIAGTGFPAARAHLAEALPGARVEAVDPATLRAAGREAEVLIPTMARVDGALMEGVRGLRLVQQWGAGLEGVDIPAATARGIPVANVPTGGSGNAESVAEWCVLAALALGRRLRELDEGIRAGRTWGAPMGRALLGRTAGILGLGGIGRALAPRLKPFGMRVVAATRRPDPALAGRLGLDWVGGLDELPALLRQSELLFLCLPVTEETRRILDARALALLPQDACVVNPARGGLVDEEALLAALDAGRLLGAGLDVFAQEPLPPASPLLAHRAVLATPHVAGATDVSYRGIARGVAENVGRLLRGEPLLSCANAAALRR